VVGLVWRNNDIDAEYIHILRKTEGRSWGLVDSVPASLGAWADSSVVADTRYTYGLIATSTARRSDTSNTMQVTVPAAPAVLLASGISVSWHRGGDSVVVSYEDISNSESAHVLYRKQWPGPWIPMNTTASVRPEEMGPRQFVDHDIPENEWFSYKVAATNGSDTVFSPDTAIYNYEFPAKTVEYSMERIGAIPAHAVSWAVVVGDSLFFPELVGQSDTAIAVVSITDPTAPRFVDYLDPDFLPSQLVPTPVGAKLRLGVGCRSVPGGYLVASGGGVLSLYDTASYEKNDSVGLPLDLDGSLTLHAVCPLNDTVVLVEVTKRSLLPSTERRAYRPLLIRRGELDTFPQVYHWFRPYIGSPSPHAGMAFRGTSGNRALYSIWEGTYPDYTYGFMMQDFSFGPDQPLTFRLYDQLTSLSRQPYALIDSATACVYSTGRPGGTVFTFLDRFDAHAGPESNLDTFTDSLAMDDTMLAAFVDQERQTITTVGSSTVTVYRYQTSHVGVRCPRGIAGQTHVRGSHVVVADGQLLVAGPRTSRTLVRVFAPNGRQLARVSLGQGAGTTALPLRDLNVHANGLYMCIVEDQESGVAQTLMDLLQ